MKVSEVIADIREEANDISNEYSNKQLMRYINSAIQQVSLLLINHGSYLMIEEKLFRNGDSLPKNFSKFAGFYPVQVNSMKIEFIDSAYNSTGMALKFFATKPNVTDEAGNMPFEHDAVNSIIIQSATIMALNRNEFDVTQDLGLCEQLKQVLVAAGTAAQAQT